MILQGKHDRAQSFGISVSMMSRIRSLPIKAWKNVRKKKKVSVPDEKIKY